MFANFFENAFVFLAYGRLPILMERFRRLTPDLLLRSSLGFPATAFLSGAGRSY